MDISEFLSEASEVHALWHGFFRSWCSVFRDEVPEEAKKDIETEYHYYTLGYFLGRIVQAILVFSGIRIVL